MSNQQNSDQHQNVGAQTTKKRRLIDKVCPSKILEIVPESQTYHDMFVFERKLDNSISKKTSEIQEALKRPQRVKKTLRIFLSNLFYTHQDTGAPSWELRIEGRLTDDPSTRQKRKFSSLIKSLIIELDRDLYGPDNHLIEWNRASTLTETDGFQVRRNGGQPVKCTIIFQLEHQPRQYKIDRRLARLLQKRQDTRPAIISAIWHYIKSKSLQDQNDKEFINNDRYLKAIFECKRMKFVDIPEKLNSLLSPPDPIVIEHCIVRGVGETQRSIYEIDVEVEDNSKDAQLAAAYMMSNSQQQELQQLEEKICDTLEAIKLTRNTLDLYTSFAKDPHQFTNRWLASHSSDLSRLNNSVTTNSANSTMANSVSTTSSTSDQQNLGDSEEERRAEFYFQPWMQEAVCQYFYRKIQEKRGDTMLNHLIVEQ